MPMDYDAEECEEGPARSRRCKQVENLLSNHRLLSYGLGAVSRYKVNVKGERYVSI